MSPENMASLTKLSGPSESGNDKRPLCIDLFCGLGGWAEGFLSEGYRCLGFDIEAHDYGTGGYPGELVLRDVRSIHGSEFRDATIIVASPPCQAYGYRAMPWKRAKALPPPSNDLFDACFRIQREASEAAGRYIPLIVENVRGAQKWVGRARWHFGSYYLWGDVPALMPPVIAQKFNPDGTTHGPGSWFAIADSKNRGVRMKSNAGTHERTEGPGRPRFIQKGKKVLGIKLSEVGFNVAAAQRYREGVKQAGISGPRNNGKGDKWFQDGAARHGSKSDSRKAASAMIAKIPFPLAQHIARVFNPVPSCTPSAPPRSS